jgi:hypothetical protein
VSANPHKIAHEEARTDKSKPHKHRVRHRRMRQEIQEIYEE